MEQQPTYTSFAGSALIVSGPLPEMLRRTKQHIEQRGSDQLLIFEDRTGNQIDFDFRGTADEVVERAQALAKSSAEANERPVRTGPGRPKLGVVSREISLLPRHWEWLEHQPQGASAAIRRLVDEARKRDPDKEEARRATFATGKVMTVLAGNLPGFEEAYRALFAANKERFEEEIRDFPEDLRAHLSKLSEPSFRAPKQ